MIPLIISIFIKTLHLCFVIAFLFILNRTLHSQLKFGKKHLINQSIYIDSSSDGPFCKQHFQNCLNQHKVDLDIEMRFHLLYIHKKL